jgi:hypothetical protein
MTTDRFAQKAWQELLRGKAEAMATDKHENNPNMAGEICMICGDRFHEYGHSANPVKPGRCCNRCNSLHVIPAKIAQARAQPVGE